MDYKKFESKSRIRGSNIMFLMLMIFTLFNYIMMYIFSEKLLSILYTSIIFLGFYIFFSRGTSRIEFKENFCCLSTPPFLKHKHKINKTTFIFYGRMTFIFFKEPFYKVPFYIIMLNDDEEEKLIEYLKRRGDIKIKNI